MSKHKRHCDKYKNKFYLNFYEITNKYHTILITNTHNKELWYFDQVKHVYGLNRDMPIKKLLNILLILLYLILLMNLELPMVLLKVKAISVKLLNEFVLVIKIFTYLEPKLSMLIILLKTNSK